MPPLIFVIILALFLAVAFAIGIRALIEPQCLELSSYELPPATFRIEEGTRTDAGTPLRLLLFTDYHFPLNRLPLESIFSMIADTEPDVVVFGGDMTSHPSDREAGLFIAGRIAAHCADKGIPYLAIRGNHDEDLTPEEAAGYGFPLLINEHFFVKDSGGRWWQFLGLEDIRLGKADVQSSLARRSSFSPAPKPYTVIPAGRRVVLAHNPDTVLELDRAHVAFCLSGHFHGGQIHLPLHLEYNVLRGEVLCRCGFTKGSHPIRGLWHFISRGFGNVLFPLRLDARPEISLITLHESTAPAPSETNDKIIAAYLLENDPVKK
ncbi:MAG: hypothetical protein GX588_03090 [Clostridiaceae bacterium]|nr:hypothetical protein [Clostridiaceae bacterium]